MRRRSRHLFFLLLTFSSIATGIVLLWAGFAIPAIERTAGAALGFRVTVERAIPGWQRVVLRNVTVYGAPPFELLALARLDQVDVEFGGPGYSMLAPSRITVDDAELLLLTTGAADNFHRPRRAAVSSGEQHPHQPSVQVRNGRLRLLARLPGQPAVWARCGLSAELTADRQIILEGKDLTAEVAGVVTGRWARLYASGAMSRNSATVRATGGRVDIPGGGTLFPAVDAFVHLSREGLRGRVVAGPDVVASLSVAGRQARFELDAHGVPLASLGPAADRWGLALDRAAADVRASMSMDADGRQLPFKIDAALRGVSIQHPRLGPSPWDRVDVSVAAEGDVDRRMHRVSVTRGRMQLAGLPFAWRGWLEFGASLRGNVSLGTAAPVACDGLLGNLPAAVVGPLAGLSLGGRLGLKAALTFDASAWDKLALSVEPEPMCQVRSEPGALQRLVAALAAGARPEQPWADLPLAAYHSDFVPLAALPRHLAAAFLTAEDGHFYNHHGFDLEMIRRALAHDLEIGSPVRGASTLTQQLAKNLFLAPDRTWGRKLAEAVLAWRIDALLPKDRILELYLNLIELGPGIRGVAAASRTYFGKPIKLLSPLQAAHLAALTPNPVGLSRRFRDGQIDEGWLHRLYDLLAMMKRSGKLSAAEVAAARAGALTLRKI